MAAVFQSQRLVRNLSSPVRGRAVVVPAAAGLSPTVSQVTLRMLLIRSAIVPWPM